MPPAARSRPATASSAWLSIPPATSWSAVKPIPAIFRPVRTVPVASRPTVTVNGGPPGFAARLSPDGTTLSPVQLFPNFLRDLGDPTGGAIVATASGSALVAGANVFSAAFLCSAGFT